jgi:hypothetical protein
LKIQNSAAILYLKADECYLLNPYAEALKQEWIKFLLELFSFAIPPCRFEVNIVKLKNTIVTKRMVYLTFQPRQQ